MILTLRDYSLIMGLDPAEVSGVTVNPNSCVALDCNDRNKLSQDILWAESVIEAELKKYGMSLYYKTKILSSDRAYFWLKEGQRNAEIRKLNLTGNISASGGIATVVFTFPADYFDPVCDKIIRVFPVTNNCVAKPLGITWCEDIPAGPTVLTLTLETNDYSVAVIDCDTGIAAFPATLDFSIWIERATSPVLTYKNGLCGTDSPEACGICGGWLTTAGCLNKISENMNLAVFNNAPCNHQGRFANYQLITLVNPIELDAGIMDAIVSLANSRGTLKDCADCSLVAQRRIEADMGILPDRTDVRAGGVWPYNNAFGVLTPGGLSAYKTIMARVGGYAGISGSY